MTAPASRTAPIPVVQPRRRGYASWRPTSALAVVVVALVAGQAIAFAVELLAGGADDKIDGVTAISLILADVVMIAVVIAFARRSTERLTAATLGIRRTAFGPALGWILAIYFGVIALEGLYALLITALGAGGVERQDVGAPGAPSTVTAIATFAAIAVAAPIGEEIAFRGYLFPALTRWRARGSPRSEPPCCSERRTFSCTRSCSCPRSPSSASARACCSGSPAPCCRASACTRSTTRSRPASCSAGAGRSRSACSAPWRQCCSCSRRSRASGLLRPPNNPGGPPWPPSPKHPNAPPPLHRSIVTHHLSPTAVGGPVVPSRR